MNISTGRICILLFFSYLGTLTFGQEARFYKFYKVTPGQTVEVLLDAVDLPEIVQSARHGSVNRYRLSSDPRFRLRYIPFPGTVGVDTVILKAYRDDNLALKTPFYPGFIFQVNSIHAENDYYALTNPNSVSLAVTDNDVSEQGDILIHDILFTKNGVSSISADRKSIIYTPKTDGFSQIHYIACNGVDCDKGEVVVRVDARNSFRRDTQIFTIYKNESFQFLVPPSLSAPLPYYLIGSIQQLRAQFYQYTPRVAFTGKEVIRFSSSTGNPRDHVVVINIVDPFKSNGWNKDDRFYTEVNHATSFNVFSNDNLSNVSEVLTHNLEGQLSYSGAGNFQYAPDAGFNGRTNFSYVSCGEGRCDTATVYLGVHDFEPEEQVYLFPVTANRTFSLEYNVPIDDWRFLIRESTTSGKIILKADSKEIDYTPNGNFFGLDEARIEYCVTNSEGESCYPILLRFLVGAQIPSTIECDRSCVWPGDGNLDGIVNAKDVLPLGLHLGINGPARTEHHPGWYGRYSDPWSHRKGIGQFDLKYLDFDGDGILSVIDTQTLGTYYRFHHSFVPKKIPVSTKMNLFADLVTDNLHAGDWAHIKVSVGTPTTPLELVSGIHFSVLIEENYVDSTSIQWEQFSQSWFGSESVFEYSKVPFDGVYDVALVKIDNKAASGYGLLGDIKFIVEEDIDGFRSDKRKKYFNVNLEDIVLYLHSGETVELPDVPLKINLSEKKYLQQKDDWVIFPSPAHNELHINTTGLGIGFNGIQINDALGRFVFKERFSELNHLTIPLSGITSGLYTVTIHTGEGVKLVKKIQIID